MRRFLLGTPWITISELPWRVQNLGSENLLRLKLDINRYCRKIRRTGKPNMDWPTRCTGAVTTQARYAGTKTSPQRLVIQHSLSASRRSEPSWQR